LEELSGISQIWKGLKMKHLHGNDGQSSSGEIRVVFDGGKRISLADMILILANDAPEILTHLMAAAHVLRLPDDAKTRTDLTEGVDDIVARVESLCDRLQLEVGKARLRAFRSQLKHGCSKAVVAAEFDGLWHNIIEELGGRWLAFVPSDKHKFVLQHKQVFYAACCLSAYSAIKRDMESAGDCLLADLNTAAVFHLMRVAEFGLRRMARDLRVKMPKKNPIEYSTWAQVLERIDGKLELWRGKSVAKEKRRQFYSGLALPIKAFMHLWRNPVSHFRGDYDEQQAQSAYIHVSDFIQRLMEKSAGLD
jgi:hypothetical protein